MKVRMLGVLILLGSMLLPANHDHSWEPQANASNVGAAALAAEQDGGLHMLPGTVLIADEMAEALIQVLAGLKYPVGAAYFAVTDIRSIESWHFVSVAGLESANPTWRLEDAVWTGLVLLHRPAGGPWAGAVEGSAQFSNLLSQVPDTVLDPRARQELDPTLRSRVPSENYSFPWELGTSMRYGVLGVHPAGFASVVGGDWKAVDFLSDANTNLGHAPNRLLASAPGAISYVCNDDTSVAIRIGDLLYVHLLDNANLTVGHYFERGDELGQLKTGTFSDVCGYGYQSPGWFHVHWGFPDTGSFAAGGWTLDFADQLWHRGGETRDTGDWLLAETPEDPSGTTGRASVASSGAEGNANSFHPALAANGRYVVFVSSADNLVPNDSNLVNDVFIHDRLTGSTELISISSAGVAGNDDSGAPAVSPDGRYVVFESDADSLVVDDTNGASDIFLRDRYLGGIERVSISSAGHEAHGSSTNPAVSSDGRYIAFQSDASDLVSGDSNNIDVFIHDRETGETVRVSVSSAGVGGDADSESPAISADGRYVVFHSQANNLVPGFDSPHRDVYLHDSVTGSTELISVDRNGGNANDASGSPAISGDGRLVAFSSDASDLVSGDYNGSEDVFLRDRAAGTTERVSVSHYGDQANNHSWAPAISADGYTVVFASLASNLVNGDDNSVNDVYLRDLVKATTVRISYSTAGEGGNDSSVVPTVSDDGRLVAFSSWANNLVSDDENSAEDVFVRDRDGDFPYRVSGQVRHPNGIPVSGVALQTSSGQVITSGLAGDFALTFETNRTFALTPTHSTYIFSPTTRKIRVPPDALGQHFVMLTSPVTTTLAAGVGSSLAYTDTQGLATKVSIPAGAVTETLTLSLTPTYATPIAGSAFTGHAFELEISREGIPQPDFAFSLPVTISIQYSAADERLVYDKEGLLLMRLSSTTWQDSAFTCDPALPYQRDTAARVLALPICRTGTMALFGPTHQVRLPLIFRNH
jgi:Tol biopolymer transport system component